MSKQSGFSFFRFHLPTTALTICYLYTILFVAQFTAHTYPDTTRHIIGQYNSLFGITEKVSPLIRYDAQWYANVAKHGYTSTEYNNAHNAGFLPLYPLLVRLVSEITTVNIFTAGLIVAWASTVIAMNVLYQYCKTFSQKESVAFYTVVAILTFPTSFIFASMYAESLFLVFIILAFISFKKEQYSQAAVMGFLAALTRLNAIALVPAFAYVLWIQWQSKKRISAGAILAVAAPVLAVLAQMVYFKATFDDPFKYFHEKDNWFGMAELSWPWQTIMASIKQAQEVWPLFSFFHISRYVELPTFVFAVVGIVLLWRRRLHSEAIFVAGSIFLVLITGSLWGINRFTVVLFPLFYLVASILPRWQWAWYVYLFGMLFLQIITLMIFTLGTSLAV